MPLALPAADDWYALRPPGSIETHRAEERGITVVGMAGVGIDWDIRLLGKLSVRRDAHMVSSFRSERTALLLARLAFPPLRAHDRGVLAEEIWHDVPISKGRHSLAQSLYSLRESLEEGMGMPRDSLLIAEGRSVLRLAEERIRVDLMDLQAALDELEGIDAPATAPPDLRSRLETALGLYAGPLLPALDAAWLEPERRSLARRVRAARLRAVKLARDDGDPGGALEILERALQDDPLDEDLAVRTMRALVDAGRPGDARDVYRSLKAALDDRLDAEPGPEVAALAARLGASSDGAQTGGGRAAGRSKGSQPAMSGTVTMLVARFGARDSSPAENAQEEVNPSAGRPEEGLEASLAPRNTGSSLESSERRQHGSGAARTPGTLDPHPTEAIVQRGGWLVEADEARIRALFGRASQAAGAARSLRRRAKDADVGDPLPSFALHSGEVADDLDAPGGDDSRAPWRELASHADALLAAARPGQVLCSASAGALLALAGDGPSDLGWFRIGPERRAARVLCLSGTGADAAPRAEPVSAGALPLYLDRFFGRDDEQRRITSLLRQPDVRLVTITGLGGTGKTRLALEVAGRLVDEMAGAVWFVGLADSEDPARIPDAIVEAIGIPRERGVDALEQAASRLSDRASLLVFDNAEHLMPDAAGTVRTLLQHAPPLRVLATSRMPLRVPGERRVALDPLPQPDEGVHALTELAASPSARLLYDRAQSARPDFRPRTEDAADVAWICRKLEGIPLALELAAARMRVLSPSDIRSRLSDRFAVLRHDDPSKPARHRTMYDTIDWSVRLLSAPARSVLARLSVFRGGWTSESAEAVCDDPAVIDALAELTDASLIRAESVDDGLRFTMYETLREFARRLLSPEEAAEAGWRHLLWFRDLGETAEDELRGPNQARWLDRLAREHDNIRAALRRSLDEDFGERIAALAAGGRIDAQPLASFPGTQDREDDDAPAHSAIDPRREGLRLAGALWRFWFVRAHLTEGREWLEALLTTETPDMPEATSPWALGHHAAGTLSFYESRYDEARAHLRESMRLHQYLDQPHAMALTLNNLGMVEQLSGDFSAALEAYRESLTLKQQFDDRAGSASSLLNIALIEWEMDRHEKALDTTQAALQEAHRSGDRWLIGQCEHHLATILTERDQLTAALDHLRAALRIAAELSDQRHLVQLRIKEAEIHRRSGDSDRSRALLDDIAMEDLDSHPRLQLEYEVVNGELALASGDPTRALRWFDEAIITAKTADAILQTERLHRRIAAAQWRAGDPEAALGRLETALRLASRITGPGAELRVLLMLGLLHATCGDPTRGRTILDAVARASDVPISQIARTLFLPDDPAISDLLSAADRQRTTGEVEADGHDRRWLTAAREAALSAPSGWMSVADNRDGAS